tara:strand:- start:355 stop:624 length:270 start_codon:yes stop_codon:yes gene_type:complete
MSLYTESELTDLQAAVKETAKDLHKKLLNNLLKADQKRGWNPVFKKTVDSQNDLKRKFNAKVAALDEQIVAMGGTSMIEEDDVETIKIK